MSRLKRIPCDVKTEPLIRSRSDSEKSLGISLKVPENLRDTMRQEILRTIQKPGESLLKDLVEELGFVVLDLTLTTKELSSVPGIEVQTSDRNHLPLLWHKDGGIKQLASFSALFTDHPGPRRLSNTVVAESISILPSLIKSCNDIISRLKEEDAPEASMAAWRKAKSKLKALSESTADPEPSRQLSIRFAMDNFLNALELSFQDKLLNYNDYTKIINDSIAHAGDRAYMHEWDNPQTLIISSKGEFIHCRKPAQKTKQPGGKLFVKAVL